MPSATSALNDMTTSLFAAAVLTLSGRRTLLRQLVLQGPSPRGAAKAGCLAEHAVEGHGCVGDADHADGERGEVEPAGRRGSLPSRGRRGEARAAGGRGVGLPLRLGGGRGVPPERHLCPRIARARGAPGRQRRGETRVGDGRRATVGQRQRGEARRGVSQHANALFRVKASTQIQYSQDLPAPSRAVPSVSVSVGIALDSLAHSRRPPRYQSRSTDSTGASAVTAMDKRSASSPHEPACFPHAPRAAARAPSHLPRRNRQQRTRR
jgi:hypothetical protein